MSDMGWIKLHRQIWHCKDIWDNAEPFDKRSAWIDLLLMANHEPRTIRIGNETVTIERGQLHTSKRKLAERWHWSRGKVERFLRATNRATMTATNETTNGTTVTIENYSSFQSRRATNEATDGATNGATVESQTRSKEYETALGRAQTLPERREDEDTGPVFNIDEW